MSQKRFFKPAVGMCVVIGLVFGYFYLNSQMDKPLGPALRGSLTEQPGSNFSQLSTLDQIPMPVKISVPVQRSLINQTNQPRPLCGNMPVLTILLVGTDYRGDDYLYGMADSIRIVRIDFTTHKVSTLTFERDIWVEIPGISDHYGITHGKLNQSYFYGTPGMGYYDGPGAGAGLLASTLKLNFGLDVDNFLVVSMAAFVKGVDALGGIDVYLPNFVNGNLPDSPGNLIYQNLGYFPAGINHLSGTQALALARIRFGYTTIIRNENQDLIFKSIFRKITSPSIILKVPELLQILKDTVLTDLTPRQIGNMICLVSKMNRSDLGFTAIPKSDYVESTIYDPQIQNQTFIWKIDFDVFRSFISQFINGQVP
jgi:LCP family protein required for cell wall assembly